jgi:hypothetical protein
VQRIGNKVHLEASIAGIIAGRLKTSYGALDTRWFKSSVEHHLSINGKRCNLKSYSVFSWFSIEANIAGKCP